jgi:hypothetical protein
VKAARALRDVIWLGEGTTICARPVSRELWALFTQDKQAAGRHIPEDDLTAGRRDAPATGMWGVDAARFVAWLNSHFDDGTVYRLPTTAELTDPAIGLVADLKGQTIWAHGDTRPHLYQPEGVPWPYQPDLRTLRRYPAADREHATPYLRLVVRPLALDRGSARLLDLDREGRRAPDRVERLPHAISWAGVVKVRDLARDLARDLKIFTGGHAPGGDLDSALDFAAVSDFRPSTFTAFQVLVGCRATVRTRRSRAGEEVTSFDEYLTGIVTDLLKSRTPSREPPDVLVRKACDLLDDMPGNAGEPMATAKDLAAHVQTLISPILDRMAPCDPMALVCARIELHAVLAVLRRPRQGDAAATPDAGRAAVLLAEAVRGLVSLQERAEGRIIGTEVLLLVRQ